MNNMNRIPAWDGSADKWTENEVLWFEQSLKPSERPQQVARLFEALSDAGKKAIQSERAKTFAGTLSNTWSSCNRRLESFQCLTLESSWTTTGRDRPWQNGASDQMGVCQRLLSALERATGRKTRAAVHDSSAQMKPDEQAE